MAASKVVKLEDVQALDPKLLRALDVSRTGQTGSTILAYGTDSSLIPTSRLDVGTEFDDQEDEEEKDKLWPLPENWPRLPQIFRRRSCELTTSTSPCVNKVISHLELLQNSIEDWFKEKEDDRKSSAASRNLKDVRFTETRDSQSKRFSSGTSRRTQSTRTPSAMSIQGIGFKQEEQEPADNIPYLGAEDAIDEVMTLLARLENDRQETEEALIRERERVVRLGNKIDMYCSRRMKDLPAVVQKEHEECIVDLNELQWHVAYSSRNESRIKDRVDIAEVLNNRLKEDIEFVKKHIPLVEEKLELELEAMEKIRSAQSDTNQELDSTKNRQEKTEAKSNEATEKAEKERAHIKHEVDTVRDALSTINEELSEAKMTFNAYTHQINDIEQQLKDNEQELKVLEVKNENAKVAEEMQSAKVQDITGRIADAEEEHTKLDAENSQLLAELNQKKSKYNTIKNKLDLAIKRKDSQLRQVVLRNQEVEMEVQDQADKIADCQRQKVADEKNVARIHKEMAKIAQQMSVTQEEFSRIASINATIRDTLTHEQEKAFKTEESLKMTADTLRKQVKDEVHQKTVLASRITSDSQDLQKSRGDIKEKRAKVRRTKRRTDLDFDFDYDSDYPDDMLSPASKVAEDVVAAVKTVKEKVDKLRSAKEDKARKKRELSAQREETVKQMQESETKFEERLNKMRPHHKHLKEDLLNVSKRLDHIEWKTDIMNNKMGDMDKSQGMIDRMTANTSKALETLGGDHEELNLQIEAMSKLVDDLKFQFNEVLSRNRANDQNHRKFMEERKKVLRDMEEEKTRSIHHNKELASKYRTLQNSAMVNKDQFMNQFEERVKLENAIKDCRELQALQIRMHGFMMDYYKYRGLYNSSELARFEDESGKNSEKVTALQVSMDDALVNISEFLQTQMTGETARKIAWEQVQKQEAREQRKDARAARSKDKLAQINTPGTTVKVAS